MQDLNLLSLFNPQPTQVPVMLLCPFRAEITPSLAVYEGNGYCFGCHRYVRRYAMAAIILGVWDGTGGEQGELEAVGRVRPMLARMPTVPLPDYARAQHRSSSNRHPFTVSGGGGGDVVQRHELAETFHRYLLGCPEVLGYFLAWRGLNIDSIDRYRLGWTGSDFSIPVRSSSGDIVAIRYRAHPLFQHLPKYEGLAGRNTSQLFSLPHAVSSPCDRLWIVEGEYDGIALDQHGVTGLTTTNGTSGLKQFLTLFAASDLRQPKQWVIATDQDEAGEEAAYDLLQALPNAVRARWDVGKDVSEYFKAGGDVGSIRW